MIRDTLRRIIPWALETIPSKQTFKENHKGVRGRIGIVGGARDYAGAPYYASIAAMRLGADLAYVICSREASSSIKNYSPDLIVTPLLDCPNETDFSTEMDCLLGRLHTLVIGPGLGREGLLQSRAKILIEKAKANSLHLILDADSLLLVYEDPQIIKSYPNAVLTPNRIELQRLLNSLYAPKTFDLKTLSDEEVEELVRQCSTDLDVTILAKGMVDITSNGRSGTVMLTDPSFGSNRRCGGQGDILAGLAGTYLHWIHQANAKMGSVKIEHPAVMAGHLAAVTTRICNELAYKERRNGMLASDMIDKIPIALDNLLGSENIGEEIVGRLNHVNQSVSFEYSGLMSQDEIQRYSRQMIMDEFGPERQIKLKQASAVVIGAGGLGCPVAAYLGAGGIGRLGIVDDDKVESSNLHRQILHNMNKVGMLKTDSMKEAVLAINPNVKIDTHSVKMTRENAVQIIENYDFVIDATDNLVTRYMIGDACVVAKKPLISGAALKMDGQLTIYSYDQDTPCFRCLFPVPPPANAVGSCSDNGVLGVIPGVIGTMQALEALKLGAGLRPAYVGKMLLFDGQLGLFRHITLAKKRLDCEACGTKSKLDRKLINYEEFCLGAMSCQQQKGATNDILACDERVSVDQYRSIVKSGEAHLLLDVRPKAHSDVSRFANALQIPLIVLMKEPDESRALIGAELTKKATNKIYIVCRRGIASQRAAKIVKELFEDEHKIVIMDIVGGMTAWAKQVDPTYSCV